jgi:hypothetical protein
MNEQLALETEQLFPKEPRWGNMDWAPLPGTLRDEWDFILSGDPVYWGLREVCKRRFWERTSFSMGAPLGEPGGVFVYRGHWETEEGGLWKRGISVYGSSVRETWRGLLYWGPWSICFGSLWKRASTSIGAPLGFIYQGRWETDEESSGNGTPLSMGALRKEPGNGLLYWGTWRIC